MVRPLGGLIIGYVGDKHGRKNALTRSLFLMAIPTTLMGCLPTYERVGVWAIVLLVACRLLQGISVGGQLPASLVYTVEKRDPSTWGYYGSLPMVSSLIVFLFFLLLEGRNTDCVVFEINSQTLWDLFYFIFSMEPKTAANVGTLLGNLSGALLREVLTDEELLDWGWRIPFFSGILIAFVACYLQAYGAEVHTTAGVYDRQDSEIKNPIRVALARGNRLALLSTCMTPMIWAAGFYVSFVWMAIFMEELLDPPIKGAFWINATSMLVSMTCMLPLAGMISDRVGRVRMMTISGIGLTGLGPVLLILISKGNSIVAFLCQVALGILLSFFGGPLCAWLVENFSPEVRLTSASLGYDLSHALVGGFSPAMATVLFDKVGTNAPGLIYIVFGTISLIGIYITHCCGAGNKKELMDVVDDDLELHPSSKSVTEGELPNIS